MTADAEPDADSASEPAPELVEAIQQGDVDRALRALEADAGAAEARQPGGPSVLLLALYHRQEAIAEAIRARRASLDGFEAAALGDVEALERALEEDPGVIGQRAADGFTALHLAAFFGRDEAVRALLARGADVGAVAENATHVQPLHSAAASGRASTVALLLEAGADPNVRQAGGYTALQSAALHGNVAMASSLLAHGADPSLANDEGATPADLARDGGHTALVALLEEA